VGEVITVAVQPLVQLAGEQGCAVHPCVVKKPIAAGHNLQANLRQRNQDLIDVLDARGDADDRDELGKGREVDCLRGPRKVTFGLHAESKAELRRMN
jgi:hypothetical protein